MTLFNVHDYIEQKLPLQCCAHRGFSGLYPENTLLAFQKALEVGADLIEFDVQVTSDKKLVVIHDSTVDRVTDGVGRVSELTVKQIQDLDAGWGEQIPLFRDVIDEFGGRIGMNIHMKIEGKAVDATIKYCRNKGILDHIFFAISSFEEIQRIRETYPRAKICSLYRKGSYLESAIKLNVRIVQPEIHSPYFTKQWVNRVHSHGIVCSVFYADTLSSLLYCQRMGVDAILTNFPNNFLETLRT